MTDAFDQWTAWRHRAPDDTQGLPAEVYGAVMSIPIHERSDRQKVNEAVRRQEEARREGRTVWVYFNPDCQQPPGAPDWVKLFASGDDADGWLAKNDPEGVAWEFSIEGGRTGRAVCVCLATGGSGTLADRDGVTFFASRLAAEKWLENNAPKGKMWEYPLEE